MTPFTVHQGIAAPLLQPNIDTDTIIPSREMKRVSKHGLSEGLFANWRYTPVTSRIPNAAFILNDPRYTGTSILLGGPNFGCGSSREHAVWALAEYGIRAILAPSFGAIFQKNCTGNGLLTAQAEPAAIESLAAWIEENPEAHQLVIDLPQGWVGTLASGRITQHIPIQVRISDRERLLSGLDAIDVTLKQAEEIASFEAKRFSAAPWAQL